MAKEQLYTILELSTNGWFPIYGDGKGDDVQITKEQCNERIQHHLNRGIAPDRLKAVRDDRDLIGEKDKKKKFNYTITGDVE